MFKLLNNREERWNNVEEHLNNKEERWNNGGKTVALFPQIFLSSARCTCVFIRNNKSLKLVGYKILRSSIPGMLDSLLNLSIDF